MKMINVSEGSDIKMLIADYVEGEIDIYTPYQAQALKLLVGKKIIGFDVTPKILEDMISALTELKKTIETRVILIESAKDDVTPETPKE